MQITVYSGFSKRLNSTKQPSGGTSIDVALKMPCSVMTPSFLISGFNSSWNYIVWDSRYYYVRDIVIETNNQATFICEIDVLATFKSDITSSTQFVTRNANTYQPLLADSKYPALNNATVQTQSVGTWDSAINSTGTYVVGIVNPQAHGGVAYYTFGAGGSHFANFVSFLFGGTWLDSQSDIDIEIQKELINPFQYIVSCTWYPLTLTGDSAEIKFGYWSSGLTAGLLSESARVVVLESTSTLPRHPQQTTHGLNMNGSPFTRYNFDCWCFGNIAIDPLPFVQNNAIGFRVEVDVFTGQAQLMITNSNGGRVNKISGQFGVPIQLSQITNPVIAPAMNVLSGAAAVVGGVVTGNVVGGVIGGVSGVMNAIDSAMPQLQSGGSVGSKIAFSWTPLITATFYELPTLSAAKVGRPLMQTIALSSLSGFTMCEYVDLPTTASDEEKEKIINFMTNGFFIE